MENIIEEILTQLIEESLELRASARNDFENGILFGYYETISKILNQAEAFNMLEKLPTNLQGFSPENLLNKMSLAKKVDS